MPTLIVIVPTYGKPAVPYDLTVMDAIVADLNKAVGGTYAGAGGDQGHLAFEYRVADEAAAREAIACAMEMKAPAALYHVRVARDEMVSTHPGFPRASAFFAVLKEFTPPTLVLQRVNGQAFGMFEQTQALIRRFFPSAEFRWTPSGPERVRMSEEEGIPLTAELRRLIENAPSELEGVAEGAGYRIKFELGHVEPVVCMRVTAFGSAPQVEKGLAALELDAGAKLQVPE